MKGKKKERKGRKKKKKGKNLTWQKSMTWDVSSK